MRGLFGCYRPQTCPGEDVAQGRHRGRVRPSPVSDGAEVGSQPSVAEGLTAQHVTGVAVASVVLEVAVGFAAELDVGPDEVGTILLSRRTEHDLEFGRGKAEPLDHRAADGFDGGLGQCCRAREGPACGIATAAADARFVDERQSVRGGAGCKSQRGVRGSKSDRRVPKTGEIHGGVFRTGHRESTDLEDRPVIARPVRADASDEPRGARRRHEHMHVSRIAEDREPQECRGGLQAEDRVGVGERCGVDACEIPFPRRQRLPQSGRGVDAMTDLDELPFGHAPFRMGCVGVAQQRQRTRLDGSRDSDQRHPSTILEELRCSAVGPAFCGPHAS